MALKTAHLGRFAIMMSLRVGMAKRAKSGAPHCGDACDCWRLEGKTILCMADGLGHGEQAEVAAQAALEYVAGHLSQPLADIFHGCDMAIHHTRGVALGIAVVDQASGVLTYAGIGNICMTVHGRTRTTLANGNGIVGGGYKSLPTDCLDLKPGDGVVLTSDGVKDGLNLSRYGQVLDRDLDRLAAQIVEEFHNGRDDAAVLIARCRVS